MGIKDCRLEVCYLLHLHSDTDVCPTYPEELIVPASIPDEDIVQGAGLYNNGRIPTLCWYCKDFGVALLRGADNITAR